MNKDLRKSHLKMNSYNLTMVVLARGHNPVDDTCVFNTSKERVVPGVSKKPQKNHPLT